MTTADYEKWKAALTGLGAERLAEAIMRLACYDDRVFNLVQTLTASNPQEQAKYFRKRLTELCEGDDLAWDQTGLLAHDLTALLESLRQSGHDPKTNLELLAEFYSADARLIERCDDSHDEVGSVFTSEAQALLTEFGAQCEDKVWLQDLLIGLYDGDEYGVRDGLFSTAKEMFSEEDFEKLVQRIYEERDLRGETFKSRRWLVVIQALDSSRTH